MATLAGAQGIVPMTPAQWEQARQAGMRGEVPMNVPMAEKIDASKRSANATAQTDVLRQIASAPFTFRILSPFVQAAEAAQDPATATRMAQGVVSPETMNVFVEVTQSKVASVPVLDVENVVIQRGNALFRPLKKLFQPNSIQKEGRLYHAQEGDFEFPVSVFAPVAPITLLFYSGNDVVMSWELSVTDLRALK